MGAKHRIIAGAVMLLLVSGLAGAKVQEGIGRALFVTAAERVVIVHAFQKKTQKTPAPAIATALKRAKDIR